MHRQLFITEISQFKLNYMYICTVGCTFTEEQWSFSFDMSNEPVRFWAKSEKSKHIQSVRLLQITRRGQHISITNLPAVRESAYVICSMIKREQQVRYAT